MELSIIIPCYNAKETISDQLEALKNQEWKEQFEIVVSDNGSTDNTVDVVKNFKEEIKNLKIIDSSERPGAGFARNAGAKEAKGNYLAFCDADDVVGAGWIAAICDGLKKNEFVASRFDFERLNSGWKRNEDKGPQEKGLQKLWYSPYMEHSGGSGIAIRRSLHEKVGGFNEEMLRLMDTDYCIKVQLNGSKLYFIADAVVHVRRRDSVHGVFKQTRLWGKYNVLLHKKYRTSKEGFLRQWVSFIRSWMRLVSGMPNLIKSQDRTKWIRALGYHVGVLQGVSQHRVPPV